MKALYIMSLAAVVGCASAGSGKTARHDPNSIGEQEIANSSEPNGFEIVSKLRPMFLKTRGVSTINAGGSPYASVFLDGVFYGNVGSLRNILASQIHEIHYLSGSEASSKYGSRYGSGAIDVISKR